MKPPLRLTRLIRDETAGGMTLNRLARIINKENEDEHTGCRVNWPMLRKIRDNPEQVGLTWSMLVALHTYFKKRKASLQHLPILETRNVLEAFSDIHPLVFMLGAKPRPEEQRTDLSRWDSESYADLRAQAAMQSIERKSDLEHVLWRSPVDTATLNQEDWHRILREDQASVISIGSSLAALSTEIMMASMFRVNAFERPHFSMESQVPFCFVWLHKIAKDFRSAFGLTSDELRQMKHRDLAGRVERNQSTAFVLDSEVHEVKVEGHEWTSYAVIAAQRRERKNVWLVVSGLAGPATYGAARMVRDLSEELPWPIEGPGDVLWVPVRVKIRVRPKAKPTDGDIREVVGAEFEGSPRIWRPKRT